MRFINGSPPSSRLGCSVARSLATGGDKDAVLCLDIAIEMQTIDQLKAHKERKFICLERALDTTKKWNLKHILGDNLKAF